ncbi:MAG: MSMEG_0569 family flavin-dependent oxidoreductase [Candidatus Eremiobacteraeota bacterium]|nr:MSMEG_0569 family flavin-dependent oxidoreductase [Candidatus Eremiobacteraeota bacterium]
MQSHAPVVVIGAGQAGLSISALLKLREIDHVVLERHRIAHSWRAGRWDTFCLVTPNWQCRLPGYHYAGNDPHGFMLKDEIVTYIEEYAASFEPPLHEGVDVTRVSLGADGRTFEVRTSAGDLTCDQVVVAIGGYHVATLPRMAERFPDDVVQLHSSTYKNAESLPEGDVLVVGTGQSGAQIAEDLHLAGRRVHLCVGSAPRTARRYRGKDVVEWLDKLGYYDLAVDDHPLKEGVRAKANHYVTGRDGGRDIDLRKFALEGMRLYGRLTGLRGGTLCFADDLAQNLDRADEVSESIKTTIDRFIESHAIDAPHEERYVPVWQPGEVVRELNLETAGIASVVWCMGFHSDFRWIDVPVFDGKGYPWHRRGVTNVEGLYFLGLPWLYTWGSGRFSGIARDASHVAERIEARYEAPNRTAPRALNALAIGH